MSLAFEKLWRAWCEIEGEQRLPIPVFARPQSLRIQENAVWLEFPSRPEISALLRGVRFQAGPSFIGNFECALSGASGILKTASGKGGYSIDAKDLEDASFLAYALPTPTSQEAIMVAIGPEITGPSQMTLAAGGKITASRNLIGKTVKV